MKQVLILAFLATIAVFVASQGQCSVYSSAEALYEMDPLEKSVNPVPRNCLTGSCELYIWGSYISKAVTALHTCMGWDGPIGPWGPLAALGPIGSNTISPASVMKMIGNWEWFKQMYMNNTGPLDVPNGPMSSQGPLGDSFWTVMPKINDLNMHMQGLGIWSVLGPIGPLGALGPLGPLGPVGSHGFGANDDGEYLDDSENVVRSVKAVWDASGKKIEWPLFEKYSASYAKDMSFEDADTSFMVVGNGESTFKMTSREEQYVTVLVIPTVYTHVFGIELVDPQTKKIVASSKSVTLANWVQMKMPASATRLEIKVRPNPLNNFFLGSQFYLYVVGSTKNMLRKPHIQYTGQYIKTCASK